MISFTLAQAKVLCENSQRFPLYRVPGEKRLPEMTFRLLAHAPHATVAYPHLSSRALPRGRAAASGTPGAIAGGGWLTAGCRLRTRLAGIAIPVAVAGARADRGQIQVWRGQATLLPAIERQQEGGEGQQ